MGIDGKSDDLIAWHIKADELLLFFFPLRIRRGCGGFCPPFSRCHAVKVRELLAERLRVLSVKIRNGECSNDRDRGKEIFHWQEL